MAIRTTGRGDDEKRSTFNEINITPLTDIFLVLLIIMMVIAPSFQSMDNNIKMPEVNSGVAVEEKNATVSLTKEGEFFLNGERLENEEALEEKLIYIADNSGAEDKKEVVVKADAQAKSSEIMKIMRAAQAAGFEKLIVAGEPLSKKEQEKLKEEQAENQG
jgi:biopolymer transport protein ExbD/biopolymer transport protein TolR